MIELPENIDLVNPEFLKVWDLIRNTRRSVFLTGKAGTGKSTFLRYICEKTKKKYIVLAPTGIAAMNVGGVTLHSFFQIPMRPVPPDDPDYCMRKIQRKLKLSKEKVKIIKNLDLVIIDEISMVRADVIDFIDRVLRSYRGQPREPFGGCQMLLVGDIFQLEPVVTADLRTVLSYYYKNCFFFSARVYETMELVSIELQKVYRQDNESYVRLLDRIRVNEATEQDIERINSRYSEEISSGTSDFTITLAARRETVDYINAKELEAIPGDSVILRGKIDGDFPDKLLPTEKELTLKPGAQMLFVKNDKDRRWVNGTIARVHSISDDAVSVELESGDIHVVEPETWENMKYTFNESTLRVEEKILGTFTQLPVKPAWALTVHKSQGLTFNRVIIDLGDGAFAGGQTYVALSRCTSLEGVTMRSRISRRDIIVNPHVVAFSRMFNSDRVVNGALNDAKADALYLSALKSFDSGNFDEAVAHLGDAVKLRNDLQHRKVQRFVAMRLGLIRRQQTIIDDMQRERAELAREYIDMGGECLMHGEMWEAALANFRKALRLDSSNTDAMYGVAQSFLQGARYDEAESAVGELLHDKKNWQANVIVGQCRRAKGDTAGALLFYGAAIAVKKKDADLHLVMADLLDSLELFDEADHHRALAAKYRKP